MCPVHKTSVSGAGGRGAGGRGQGAIIRSKLTKVSRMHLLVHEQIKWVFYILLAVHLCLFVMNNHLDAQFLLYVFIYFDFSTCFEQLCAHHQESQLYQFNVWYMSGRNCSSFPTCIPDGHLHRVPYTRCCTDTIDSPDDEHRVARNM
jgi:hypothetical protein